MKTEVKFYPNRHIYTINGVIVPSVTQIVRDVLKQDLSHIPRYILANAARFGTSVHEGIEAFFNGDTWMPFDEREARCVFNYIKLKQDHEWYLRNAEQIVAYKNIFAGRYDQIVQKDDKLYLLDIKTNYKLDIEYLSWQLSLYELALGEDLDGLLCAWLQKNGKAELVDVPRVERSLLLEEVERVKENQSVKPF